MKLGIQKLPTNYLIRRKWLEPEMRVEINKVKVKQYAEEKADGSKFPPAVVFFDPKKEVYYVGDGFHRILADRENNDAAIVDLKLGTLRDAILFNIESNGKQKGLPFGHGDFRKAIETILKDEEWRIWSDQKIADLLRCSHKYVQRIKGQFYSNGEIRPDTVKYKDGRIGKRALHKLVSPEDRKEKILEMFIVGTPRSIIHKRVDVSPVTINGIIEQAKSIGEICACPKCGGSGWIKCKT